MLDLLDVKFEPGFKYPELKPVRGNNYPPKFELAEDWEYRITKGYYIVITKGSIVDGASVPRAFWFLIPPHGTLLLPSIIHDSCYVRGKLLLKINGEYHWLSNKDRAYWDRLFLKVSRTVTPRSWRSWVAYWALIQFGQKAWDKYRDSDPTI